MPRALGAVPPWPSIRFDPTRDVFLDHHRLRGKPLLPCVVEMECLAEAAASVDPRRRVIGLRDVEIFDGLLCHGDRTVSARVAVIPGQRGLSCTLTSELRDRKERLIREDRPHMRAIVELGDAEPELQADPPGRPLAWHAHVYPDDLLLRHGPALRYLKEYWYQYDGGWGKIVAPSPAELAGSRPAQGWILPLAVLDACLVACGGFMYVQFGQFVLPQGFDRLRLGRQPAPARPARCASSSASRQAGGSRFDFTLFGSDGTVVLQAEGHRTIHVTEGAS